MPDILAAVQRAADAYDRSPVSPRAIGQRIWHAGLRHAERDCMRDPEYARIESLRRDPDRPGCVLFLSKELGLGLPEDEYQRNLRKQHTPAWAEAALALSRVSAGDTLGKAVSARERSRTGWSRADAWNAGQHLASVAAGMLDQMAREGISWPGESDEFPNPESWHDALAGHSAALARYSGDDPEADYALTQWHQLATNPDTANTNAAEAARDRMYDLDAKRAADAQAAMHWVADHLTDLWD